MFSHQMMAASDLLYDHWIAGKRMDALPTDLRPIGRADGYGVQAFIETRSAHPLFGWKIAATSTAGQAHINVDRPLAGRILAETVIEDGGACPLGANQMRVAELEFAFRMGEDLAPSATPFSVDHVLEHVATLHPAIEVPDSRYVAFEKVGEASLIADNACAHRFVLGFAAPARWRVIDLAAHRVRGRIGQRPVVEGNGANVLGSPLTALTWLANELSSLGLVLAAGCVVTTGTCIVPMPIAAGDLVQGDFGELGTVSLSITA